MNFPFYIAKRYIIAKKNHNAINLISIISVVGVAIGTMALIVLLSVFNGFDDYIRTLYNSFNPDFRITPAQGKVFFLDTDRYNQLKNTEGVLYISQILEDNVLVKYDDKQSAAKVKGVDEYYDEVTRIDCSIIEQPDSTTIKQLRLDPDEFKSSDLLYHDFINFAIIGEGLAYVLGINLSFRDQLSLYVPRRLKKVSFNPEKALKSISFLPGSIFRIEPDIDLSYIIVSIDHARKLFEYPDEISSLEIKTDPEYNQNTIQSKLEKIMGDDFIVKNRYQQNELIYKTMKAEKWAMFFILAFILVIASFNIIGSLTMLIIEKKDDINTLQSLGANLSVIKRIFITEGVMITVFGGIAGLLTGLLICYLQIRFGFVKPPGDSLVIDAYPCVVRLKDVILILFTVLLVGFFVAWFPVRFVTRNFIRQTV